jgi:hypothetical protein
MGRSVHSISHRLESKISQWERFCRSLGPDEQRAFSALMAAAKDRRTAIDAADEADLGVAVLLAIVVRLQGELDEAKRARTEDRASGT